MTSQPSSTISSALGRANSGGIANGGSASGGNLSPTASRELRAANVDRLSSVDSASLPPHIKVLLKGSSICRLHHPPLLSVVTPQQRQLLLSNLLQVHAAIEPQLTLNQL